MKILLLSHRFHPDLGGIETISFFLANAFTEAGHEVHVVTWSTSASEDRLPFLLVRQPSILKLWREHHWAELVFENNPCLRLSFPNLLLRKRRIVGLHTWICRADGRVAFQDKLKRYWLRSASKVVACSEAVRSRSWPAAVVVGNPYEETFRLMPEIKRSKEFIFLGRLVSDKGGALAIHAFHQLISSRYSEYNSNSTPVLTIVGDGPDREILTNQVAAYGLNKQVLFLGALSGPALVEQLNKHKYILVPSIWEEPFGLVVLEGMACGCIPIVANSGGLPEAVGDAGLIFQKGSIKDLVASMQQLIEDPLLCESLRTSAPTHLLKHKSDVVTAKYLAAIENSRSMKITL